VRPVMQRPGSAWLVSQRTHINRREVIVTTKDSRTACLCILRNRQYHVDDEYKGIGSLMPSAAIPALPYPSSGGRTARTLLPARFPMRAAFTPGRSWLTGETKGLEKLSEIRRC
jgi:hypothetical protein